MMKKTPSSSSPSSSSSPGDDQAREIPEKEEEEALALAWEEEARDMLLSPLRALWPQLVQRRPTPTPSSLSYDAEKCATYVDLLQKDMGLLDIYDTTADVCVPGYQPGILQPFNASSSSSSSSFATSVRPAKDLLSSVHQATAWAFTKALGSEHVGASIPWRMALGRGPHGGGGGVLGAGDGDQRLTRKSPTHPHPIKHHDDPHRMHATKQDHDQDHDDHDDHDHDQNRRDVCVDEEMTTYLNRLDVQKALHVVPQDATEDDRQKWDMCSSRIRYSETSLLTSMIPVYRDLLGSVEYTYMGGVGGVGGGVGEDVEQQSSPSGLRVLIYVGDVDGILPILGTRVWMALLGKELGGEVEPWTPWTDSHGQTGGYTVKYASQFTLATVRDAGHMVPYTQPRRGRDVLRAYLDGNLF